MDLYASIEPKIEIIIQYKLNENLCVQRCLLVLDDLEKIDEIEQIPITLLMCDFKKTINVESVSRQKIDNRNFIKHISIGTKIYMFSTFTRHWKGHLICLML